MEGDRHLLTHSVSLSDQLIPRTDQNQNEESPAAYMKETPAAAKDSLSPPAGARLGSRLTKSASWFNSLSRRRVASSSGKPPLKKRSFAAFNAAHRGDDSFGGSTPPRPRLNNHHVNESGTTWRKARSDWDVRASPVAELLIPEPPPLSALSTDCLDLDRTCPDMSTLDLSSPSRLHEEADEEGAGFPDSAHMYYTLDSRRMANKQKKSLKERRLLAGVKQFNLEPERGLQYLEEAGFFTHTPQAVARFLFRQERLSKKQIGKYLGGHQEFNRAVLAEFVKCHEFSQLLLVQALRQFLWSFRLPGEAMQIDRVMDAFAAHYCAQNPHIFQEPDTCFILSFSIIMLNTALHNPNAKMKITADMFVKQNKGINSGKDLPADMLEAIFRNIKEEPFKIPEETYDDLMYTFFSPEREGWLLKQGGSWKNWKRRWFVLTDRCLYYFQHTAENVPKGIIPLENVRVRSVEDKDGKQWILEIYSEMSDIIKGCKTDSSGTVVQGNHKYYRMSAASEEDRDLWIQAIQESIRDNPFHKIIADKKAAIRRRSGGGGAAHHHHHHAGPAARADNATAEA